MKSNITIINAASGGAIDIPAGEAEVDVKVGYLKRIIAL